MISPPQLVFLVGLAVEPTMESHRPPDPAVAQGKAEKVEKVDELEQRGRYPAAARHTEALIVAYPQDYGLRLRAGWLRFNAGHWRRAQRHYRAAMELSHGSLDSRLGLGWSLLRDGRRRAAITTLEALARDAPEVPEVAAAVQAARTRPVVVPSAWSWLTGQAHPRHATLRQGLGGQVGLGLRIAEHGLVNASYGFARLRYQPTEEALAFEAGNGDGAGGPGGSGSGSGSGSESPSPGPGPGPGSGRGTHRFPYTANTIDQHQIHASVGVTWPVAGGLLQYGVLLDQGLATVHALGTSLRWSPWGDVVLDTSVTIEGGLARPRMAPSWRLPVHRSVWLRPGASLQVDGSEALGTGRLTLGVHGRPGTLWVGGMGGRERRPALLDVPVVFNLAEDLRFGAWVGGSVSLPHQLALLAGYEVYGLDPIDPAAPQTQAHYLTMGLSWTRSKGAR